MGDIADKLATATGVASPAVLLATLAVSATVAARYDWPREAFSVIGARGGPAAIVFNAGVVLSGLLALAFAWRVWTGWRPALGALWGLIGVSMVIAGAFPAGSPLHDVGAVIFVLAWLLPWVAGVLDWRADRRRLAVGQILLGTVAGAIWLPYDLGVEAAQVGYGGAELVAFLVLAAWSVGTAARLWQGDALDAAPAGTSAA